MSDNTKIEGFKVYRHDNNPKEKKLHNKFVELFCDDDMDLIIFPPSPESGGLYTNEKLTERERRIVLTTIQWLGSPVGQDFLRGCGFISVSSIVNSEN
jgi:hypothetical protein